MFHFKRKDSGKGWNLYLAVGIQNPIFPLRVVAAAQGCHLPCITAISQVVRSKCCPGLIKSAPTAQHLHCPQPPFPNYLSKQILVYTSSIASSSSCMLFGPSSSGLVPAPNLSNAAALQVDDKASVHPSVRPSIHFLSPLILYPRS